MNINRQTWKKDNMYITYGNPFITPFADENYNYERETIPHSMNDVMYFYYDIDIFYGKKHIFHSHTHDFPKIQDLPMEIDCLFHVKEKDMFIYQDIEDEGFHKKELYACTKLEDFDCEYFYKIEKIITYVKQRDESNFKRYENYTLIIGESEPNKEGYSSGENYGKEFYVKNLEKEDLIKLKKTATKFCNLAIKNYK